GIPDAWGDWLERALNWEVITATALFESGADIVAVRHPESLTRLHRTLGALMTEPEPQREMVLA
ncbi:MAG: hypothetical protein KAZ26_24335, partial [Caldilineaceae bacterium]|nr:hypothetical protein [Caldilineaceae bacterium]